MLQGEHSKWSGKAANLRAKPPPLAASLSAEPLLLRFPFFCFAV